MIITDYSAVAIASTVNAAMQEKLTLDENLVKHIVLSKFRDITKNLGPEFGDHVLLCDGRSWRKDKYEYYKANRGDKSKDEGPIDWGMVFRMMDECKKIFEDHFPFYVFRHPCMEADDLIASFALQAKEPVVIVSKDKDFFQLHGPTIHQWDYSKKRFIDVEDPASQRLELIIRGDSGDGVPNILSDDDTFVTEGKRQKPMSKKRLAECIEFAKTDFIDAPGELKRNWDRNKMLIDLTSPHPDALEMINRYYEAKPKQITKNDTANYLAKNKMVMLMGKIGDFYENGNQIAQSARTTKEYVTNATDTKNNKTSKTRVREVSAGTLDSFM